MSFHLENRIKELWTGSGTGNVTVAGAIRNHFTFGSKYAVNDTFKYVIEHPEQHEVEGGTGTYLSANLIERTTIDYSSNSGNHVDFSEGDKVITIVVEKENFDGTVTVASDSVSCLALLTINGVAGVAIQYSGSTKLAITATGITVSGTVTATEFLGPLTGNVTGNVTGNASTATALLTARSIYGNNFDGTGDLTQIIASTYGGTGNGFTKFSGPASTEKTFILPNASATILTDNTLVTVPQGGTGANTLTNHGLLLGQGTAAVTATTVGTNGQIMTAQTSADPLWKSMSGDGAFSELGVFTLTPSTDISWGNHKITNLADPTSEQEAATKNYVDLVAQGLSPKPTAKSATITTLPSYSYVSGVITFTATGTQTIDDHLTALNEYVLVKDEVGGNAPYNGLYRVTTAGAIGVNGVWTRADAMNVSGEFGGSFIAVENGTVNGGTFWLCSTDLPTVGTTDITFIEMKAPTSYTGAGGITIASAIISWTPETRVDNVILWDGTQTTRTLTANLSTTDVVFTFSSAALSIGAASFACGAITATGTFQATGDGWLGDTHNSYAGYTSLTLNHATTGSVIDLCQGGAVKGEVAATASAMTILVPNAVGTPINITATGVFLQYQGSNRLEAGASGVAVTGILNTTDRITISNAVPAIHYKDTTGANTGFVSYVDGSVYSISSVDDAYTASVHKLVVTRDGDVGLATSTPLHIADYVGITLGSYGAGAIGANSGFVEVTDGTRIGQFYNDASLIHVRSGTTAPVVIDVNNTEYFRVAVGAVAVTGTLSVSSTTTIGAPTGVAAPGGIALKIRDSGSLTYGFDFDLETLATGDLYCMRTIADAQTTWLHVARATGNTTFTGTMSVTVGTGAVTITANQPTFSATGFPVLNLVNSHASGQSPLDFNINGTLRGRIRADYVGNVSYVVNGGIHYFYVGGDSGVGSVVATISAGAVAITGTVYSTATNTIENNTGAYDYLSLKGSYASSWEKKTLSWRDATNITGQIDTRYNSATTQVLMGFGSLFNNGYNSTDIMLLANTGLGLNGRMAPNTTLNTNNLLENVYANTFSYPLNMTHVAGNTTGVASPDGRFAFNLNAVGWTGGYVSPTSYARVVDRVLEWTVDSSTGASTDQADHMMVGWGDGSLATDNYSHIVHAIYFNKGIAGTYTIEVYEDGTGRLSMVTATWGDIVRVRVVLKATGADYYYKVNAGEWTLGYVGTYSTETPLYPSIAPYGNRYILYGMHVYDDNRSLHAVGYVDSADLGIFPDQGYKGTFRSTRAVASGQHINLLRYSTYGWSIGFVYNTSTFAIGTIQATDSNFTAPQFQMDTSGNVTIRGTLEVTSTSAQVYVKYDPSNYCQMSVSSAGVVTFSATGASAGFKFEKPVTANSVYSASVGNIKLQSSDNDSAGITFYNKATSPNAGTRAWRLANNHQVNGDFCLFRGTSDSGAPSTLVASWDTSGDLTQIGHTTIGGGATASEMRFLEPSGGGTSYVGFKSPALAGNTVYDWPNAFPAANGYVLSCTTAGVQSWISPGTMGGWALLGTATASSSASVAFTGLSSTYAAYAIVFTNVVAATDNAHLTLRTSTNGGSSYDAGGTDYQVCDITANVGSVSSSPDNYSSIYTAASTAGLGNASNEQANGIFWISDPSAAKYCTVRWEMAFLDINGNLTVSYGAGYRSSAADVDAVQILMESGNIASGEFRLYGLKDA